MKTIIASIIAITGIATVYLQLTTKYLHSSDASSRNINFLIEHNIVSHDFAKHRLDTIGNEYYYKVSSSNEFDDLVYYVFGSNTSPQKILGSETHINYKKSKVYNVIAFLPSGDIEKELFEISFHGANNYLSQLGLGISFKIDTIITDQISERVYEADTLKNFGKKLIPKHVKNTIILIQARYLNCTSVRGHFFLVDSLKNNGVIILSKNSNNPSLIAHELNHIQDPNDENDTGFLFENNLMSSSVAVNVSPCYTDQQYLEIAGSARTPINGITKECVGELINNSDIDELEAFNLHIECSDTTNKNTSLNLKAINPDIISEKSYDILKRRFYNQYNQLGIKGMKEETYVKSSLENLRKLRMENIINRIAFESVKDSIPLSKFPNLKSQESIELYEKYKKYYQQIKF